jgi:hypothetical protein
VLRSSIIDPFITDDSGSERSNDDTIVTRAVIQQRARRAPLVAAALAVAGLAGLVIATGSADPEVATPTTVAEPLIDAPTSSTTIDETSAIDEAPSSAASELTAIEPTSLSGLLSNGRWFQVEEPMPGVLCATIESAPRGSERVCHHENLDASGAAVLDELIFGYLSPGADSARVRYRQANRSATPAVVDQQSGYFALPVVADDPYRLQYLGEGSVVREAPLSAPSGAPSQSPDDAERDGVDPALAALPFIRRVSVVAEVTSPSEGPYVVSSHATEAGAEFELLLLGPSGTAIVQAHPFGRWEPDDLVVGTDAVFLLATRPDEHPVLARIDRISGERTVRVLIDSSLGSEPELAFAWWTAGDPLPPGVVADALRWLGNGNVSIGYDGFRAFYQAETLEPAELPGPVGLDG